MNREIKSYFRYKKAIILRKYYSERAKKNFHITMSKSNDAIKEKELNEKQFTSDSGFHSGFQDSQEISSSEVVADKNEFDSSMKLFEPPTIQITPYFPDFLTACKAQKSSVIDKYFDNSNDEFGLNVLHMAILHYNWPAINTLIQLAPDPEYLNIKNCFGQTAVHLAVLLDQHTSVQMLINHGANLNSRDNRGKTPLHGKGRHYILL